MLWVGWFGFNAGSALAANGDAGMAMLVTHLSAAMGSLVWLTIEWVKFGKPSLVGIVTGMVAGLATITPASGFVGPIGALIIGLVGGIFCYYMVGFIKHRLKIDDSLDVFAVHGVGGVLGTLMVAVLVDKSFGGAGLEKGMTIASQFGVQLTGFAAVLVWAVFASYVLVKIVQSTVGLRVSDDEELEGLDVTSHGETGYSL